MKFRHVAAIACTNIVAVTMVASTPAFGQETTEQVLSESQNVRLDIARSILDISYPEETREPMFRAVGDQMEAQMLQSLKGNLDEDALLLIRDWQAELKIETNAILKRNIPSLMDAWARSLSEIFDEAELRDILTFVSTETGRTFMLKSTDIVSHRDFVEANQVFINETMEATMAALPALMEDVAAYKEAKQGSE